MSDTKKQKVKKVPRSREEDILLYKKYEERYFKKIRILSNEIWEDLKKDDIVSLIFLHTSLEEMEHELHGALLGWDTICIILYNNPSTI